MTLQIPYQTKINERLTGQSITAEPHIIGILNTATYSPGFIRLVEVPQAPAPLSSVSIPGYTEIMSGTPTGIQFVVDYETGVITFDTAQDGNSIAVSYIGLGSEFAAEDVNELQNPLGTVATQSITYNWPSAPTVTWSLAPNVVIPSSITNISTDDFTFPRDVFVTRNLITPELTSTTTNPASIGVVRLANSSDSVSWRNAGNTADLSLTVNGSNQLTFNGTPIELGTLTSAHIFVGNGSNVATDTAMTGDVSITNTGVTTVISVGGSSAANIHSAELAANAATNVESINTIVKRDGSGGFEGSTVYLDRVRGRIGDIELQPKFNSTTGVYVLDSTGLSTILSVDTSSQVLNMNSHFITNMLDPLNPQDAATKNYVDTHGTSPGGSTGDLQYNNSGVFGGATNITTDGTNLTLTSGTVNVSAVTAPSVLTVTAGSRNWLFTSDGGIVLPNLFADPSISTGKVVYNSTSNLIDWYNGTTWQETASQSYVSANFLALIGGTLSGSLGIGESPVVSAILDVASTTQGFLPPRMTTTQRTAISSPATALMVYDTTLNQWMGWNGSSWVVLG